MKPMRFKRKRPYGSANSDRGTDYSDRNKTILNRKRRRFEQKRDRKANTQSVESVIAKYETFMKEDASKLEKFEDFPLSTQTQNGLSEADFVKPTEIQRDSLQYSLTGVDVVGAAKTGSGKTLALLIPLLECLWRQRWSRNTDGLGALVISPTRELAYQTFNVLNKIGKYHNFSAALLIGGTDVEYEKSRLATVNVVICTPGRLLQHMDENCNFCCEQLQMLVIDEADRILDLGFQRQMNSIIENLPRTRQTLLFSATQTKNVKDLARLALKDPVYISVHENASQATPDQLQQSYLVCSDEDKINLLWSYLVMHRKKKSLIFVSCCKQARFFTEALCHLRPGTSLMGLWGTMKQSKRLEVFHKFNRKVNSAAMIATDVASRGLDFARVDCVLQLDCPTTADDYIHRVGRTARMDAKGEGLLVLTPSQEKAMIERLKAKNIPISKISIDQRQMLDIHNKLQSTIAQFQNLREFAQRSFVAYIRSIYLMANKDVFDVQSIDCKALAESYGLAVVPRVRFLARAGVVGKQNESRSDWNPSEESEIGRVAEDGVGEKKKEKTASELLEMILKSAKNRKEQVKTESAETERDQQQLSGESDGGGDGIEEEATEGDRNEHEKDRVEFELKEEFLVGDVEDGGGHEMSDKGSDNDGDDLFKVVHKDVFNVLDEAQNDESDESLMDRAGKRDKDSVLKKSTLVKRALKKGLKLNVKKKFDENGEEIIAANRYQYALPTTTTEKTSDSAEGRFNLEDAKREMREADQFDKAAYRERMKKLRQEKKAKLKKKLNEQRKGNEETSGGAVLDLADRQGDSGESGGEDAGGNEDLSWLPDPDKPKKYDEQWNEIVDDNADEGNEPSVEQRITSDDGDVTESLKKKKRKKEITSEKMKKSQKIRTSNVIDAEAKALALLEGTN